MTLQADGAPGPMVDLAAPGTRLDDSALSVTEPGVHAAVRAFLDAATVTLPPSAAVAGLYATTDRTRGVWKAPANAALALVLGPAVPVNDALQDRLRFDPAGGLSVNAIRSLAGRGTLVWGARTLAGNDTEWRHVSTRRLASFVEMSVARALGAFVFEPNDADTWARVRAMIEDFLMIQWRGGALAGARPDEAFHVSVGLGRTMTAQDVIEGRMIVGLHLAMVRPAEFLVLRITQMLQQG
jgi:phage tail sheath protein FI